MPSVGSDHVLFSAATLQTPTALHVASFTLLAVGLTAEFFVKLFGNWLILFRRFATRLSLWLAILGTSGYLSLFFLAQAVPSLRPGFFYWAHTREATGADWVLRILTWSVGASGCFWYVVSCLEWLFTRESADRDDGVREAAPLFFLLERVALAAFLLFCLPGFFVILRSLWAPLSFDQAVLLRYLFLAETTLDSLSLGFLSAYRLHIVSPEESHQLAPTELWSYSILVAAVVVPFVVDLARLGGRPTHQA